MSSIHDDDDDDYCPACEVVSRDFNPPRPSLLSPPPHQKWCHCGSLDPKGHPAHGIIGEVESL